jgi:hypothetical protein
MVQAGQFLVGLAHLPDREFRHFLREQWLAEMASFVMDLENTLDLYNGEPVYWARDVQREIAACRRAMLNTDPLISVDAAEKLHPEQFEPTLKRWVGLFGELLIVWPAVFDAACQIGDAPNG